MAEQTTYRRIYQVVPGTDLVKPTTVARCYKTGNLMQGVRVENPQYVAKNTAINQGYPVVSADGKSFVNQNNSTNMNGMPFAVLPTETAQGGRTVAREETFSRKPNILQWNLTLSNGTANAVELVVFDGLTTLFQYFKLSAIPGAPFVVGGTWGTNTLATLKNFGQMLAVDLHSIWIQNTKAADGTESTGFYSDGYLRESYGDLANNAPFDSLLPLQTLLRPDDFIRNIRVFDGFRYQINPLAGLHILLPAGEKINMTLNVSAAALSYGMIKADGNQADGSY